MVAGGLAAVLLVASVLVYFLGAPVVLVSDEQFESLYGKRRGETARLLSSFRLWRRVELVLTAPSAPPSAAAEAAAAFRPACAVFPYRHLAASEAFADRFPLFPSVVVHAPGLPQGEGRRFTANADRISDWRRAGSAAALLCEAPSVPVILATGGTGEPTPDMEAAFAEGLSLAGFSLPHLTLRGNETAGDKPEAGCLVIPAGSPAVRIAEFPGIPVIMFSWIDTVLLPREVAVVFDDSPWALLERGVRAALRSASSTSPSVATVRKTGALPPEILDALSTVLRK
jgi:hypothetical protein